MLTDVRMDAVLSAPQLQARASQNASAHEQPEQTQQETQQDVSLC